jgi:hypothetical protein
MFEIESTTNWPDVARSNELMSGVQVTDLPWGVHRQGVHTSHTMIAADHTSFTAISWSQPVRVTAFKLQIKDWDGEWRYGKLTVIEILLAIILSVYSPEELEDDPASDEAADRALMIISTKLQRLICALGDAS